MKRSAILAMVLSGFFGGPCGEQVFALDTVVWGGGNGQWHNAKWTKNGIQNLTAASAMGDNTGGRGGMDIVIGGGAIVTHDHNDGNTLSADYSSNSNVDAADYVLWRKGVAPLANEIVTLGTTDGPDYTAWRNRFGNAALGDFKPRMDITPGGSLTIKEGAVLHMDSHSDADGRWTRVGLSMTLDNGTLRRTHTPDLCPSSECSVSGGKLIFGYHNELRPNQKIEIKVINGGRIENDGKMVFGEPGLWATPPDPYEPWIGHNPGIEVAMTIDNGVLDLTGGGNWPDYFGLADGDLVFVWEYQQSVGPKNEKYSINFTGPGSITVDPFLYDDAGTPDPSDDTYKGGIYVVQQDSSGSFSPVGSADFFKPTSFEQLWNLGLLQANGQSGLNGATFSNFFSVTGTPFTQNYTLTSLIPAGGGASVSGGAVPEPSSLCLIAALFCSAGWVIRRRN